MPAVPGGGFRRGEFFESMHGNQTARRLPCNRSISCSACSAISPTRAGGEGTSCNMSCCSRSCCRHRRHLLSFNRDLHQGESPPIDRRLRSALAERSSPYFYSIHPQGLDPPGGRADFPPTRRRSVRRHYRSGATCHRDRWQDVLRRSFDNFTDRKAAQVLCTPSTSKKPVSSWRGAHARQHLPSRTRGFGMCSMVTPASAASDAGHGHATRSRSVFGKFRVVEDADALGIQVDIRSSQRHSKPPAASR